MRFMILVKATGDSEAGIMPDERLLKEMGDFNEELVKQGIMLAGEGLHPSSEAVRINFSGDKRSVTEGPFPVKEEIAGYWVWNVKSRDEAIEWARRIPNPTGVEGVVEIRQIFEAEDFGDEFTPELREQEVRLREEMAGKH